MLQLMMIMVVITMLIVMIMMAYDNDAVVASALTISSPAPPYTEDKDRE